MGNFDHIIEEAYKKAYLPFLELLQQFSSLKAVLHYSGHLLLWLEKKHPEAIKILKNLVREQRVELLSGGFYEPILSSLPEQDAVMQVREFSDYISGVFSYRPKGMWLAERVWEPHLPRYLAAAGIEYLPLDDHHFKLSGLEDASLSGYFLTEDAGCSVKVFPGSEKLRYYIPFRGVEETMSHLREVYTGAAAGQNGCKAPLITMADDGEKFGVWPDTHKHCYGDGWLHSFLSALAENSDWLETTTFSEYQAGFRPKGTVYLPTASYREMGGWALPLARGLEYEHAYEEMQRLYGEKANSMLQGGIWRSFLSKYPEANHIHKRMLMASSKVHKALKKCKSKEKNAESKFPNPQEMLQELWKGQCNDAYWHGIFGGLYLPHLRSSLYRHLIRAEALAEKALSGGHGRTGGQGPWKCEGDLDNDGFHDICVSNEEMSAFFTERGGSLLEFSLKNKSINILDILARRPEVYHSRLSEALNGSSQETRTIHDRLSAKETGLADYLVYDDYRRASLLDHFFDKDVNMDRLAMQEYEERGDFINGTYGMAAFKNGKGVGIRLKREGAASGAGLCVEKTVLFGRSHIRIDYDLSGGYSGVFGIEFNLSLLGSPYPTIEAGGNRLFIKDNGIHKGIRGFFIKDEFLKLGIRFLFDEELNLRHYPVDTVSLSEEGIERIYQGTAFVFLKGLDFTGHKRLGLDIYFTEVM